MPDQLLPQPPPDAPAPPAGEYALRSQRKMGWMIGFGLGSMILLCILSAPKAIRSAPKAPITEAVANLRQIGLALFEFETEYEKFPDSSTVAEVKRRSGTTLSLGGNSANEFFAQLFVAGIVQSEQVFHAQAQGMKRRPDGVFDSDATVLEHGECAFAYIAGLAGTVDPDTPLVFGPVIPGTKTLDQKSCDGKAAVLCLDNSVRVYPIAASGKIILPNGLDLLDPRQPFWHGKAPDLRWPK